MGVRTMAGLACFVVALAGCKKPALTHERVLQELGQDFLYIHFVTIPDNSPLPCKAGVDVPVPFDEEEQAAAARAGFIEPRCKENPKQMRLSEDGIRRQSVWKWRRVPVDMGGVHDNVTSWSVVTAQYTPSGPPQIKKGDRDDERRVVIPGRWNVNDVGRLLQIVKWAPVNEVDREEVFTYEKKKGWKRRRPPEPE